MKLFPGSGGAITLSLALLGTYLAATFGKPQGNDPDSKVRSNYLNFVMTLFNVFGEYKEDMRCFARHYCDLARGNKTAEDQVLLEALDPKFAVYRQDMDRTIGDLYDFFYAASNVGLAGHEACNTYACDVSREEIQKYIRDIVKEVAPPSLDF